jgi:hypothetical protein
MRADKDIKWIVLDVMAATSQKILKADLPKVT